MTFAVRSTHPARQPGRSSAHSRTRPTDRICDRICNRICNRICAIVFLGLLLCSRVAALELAETGFTTVSAIDQTVLSARLTSPERADAIIISTHADGARSIQISSYLKGLPDSADKSDPASWHVRVNRPLPATTIALDICTIDGIEQLLFYQQDGEVRALDATSGADHLVVTGQSILRRPSQRELVIADFCHDVTGDGLDDVLLQDFTVARLFQQRAAGTFAPALELPQPAAMNFAFGAATYVAPHVYPLDHNLDGQADLAFLTSTEINIYTQLGAGEFALRPIALATPAPLNLDGNLTLAIGAQEDQSDSSQTSVSAIQDFNHDGRADLLTHTLQSKGVFAKTSEQSLYLGRADADGMLSFAATPDALIESDGMLIDAKHRDFNQDEQIDVMTSVIQLGVGRIIGALLTGSVTFDQNFYPLGATGFSDKPAVKREVKAEFSLSSGDAFVPTVTFGDVTGDGIEDLIMQESRSKLRVYPGSGDEQLFSTRSTSAEVPMPDDQDQIQLADLDGDGIEDLLLHHENPGGKSRVAAWLVRSKVATQ